MSTRAAAVHQPQLGDSLTGYVSNIRRYRLLSREAERQLAERAHQGDQQALEALVCANLRFVVSVAKKYQHQGVPLADLVSEGNLGLLRAAQRFDETKGIKFISYAVWWIRQAILQALAEQSRVARVPLSQVATLQRIGRRTNALAQQLGRAPTNAELAKGLDIPDRELGHALSLMRQPVSIDGPVGPDGLGRLADLLPDEQAPEPDAAIADEALGKAVRSALHGLRPRESKVIRLYFGLDGGESMTLEQIGVALGVTRERVRQIKEKALCRLRHGSRGRALGAWVASRELKDRAN